MKKLMLVGLVMGAVAMPVQAEDCFDADIGFPCEHEAEQAAMVVADGSTVKTGQKKDQLRLKYISRRPYLNRTASRQQQYSADDAWVGATYQSDRLPGIEKERKSNINMFSRRPYRAERGN